MQVQIFGAISSPTVCAYALRQAASDDAEFDEAALDQVVNHFYVDNWLSSFQTVDEAKDAAKMLTGVLVREGFELAQWGSSHHTWSTFLDLSLKC